MSVIVRSQLGFGKPLFHLCQVALAKTSHWILANDEQVFHGADSQHLLVERRRTGAVSPQVISMPRVGQARQAEDDACAESANRLVRKRHAGADGEEVEDEMDTMCGGVGESEKLVALRPLGRCDHEKAICLAFVTRDGSAQLVEAGDGRALAGVIEPAFGSECGELARVRQVSSCAKPARAGLPIRAAKVNSTGRYPPAASTWKMMVSRSALLIAARSSAIASALGFAPRLPLP